MKDKKRLFMSIFRKCEKKYGQSMKRLAADRWGEDWKTLVVTIMSAQSRDEMTIPIAEKLFRRYNKLGDLAGAKVKDVLVIFKSLNYNRTKAKNVVGAAKFIRDECGGKVPQNINELVKIPGVGRKTANLVRWECHRKHSICVDTHVHRISNVLGIVKTKAPEKTEKDLEKIVPRKYWGKVNRMFVLLGKEVPGRNKDRLLKHLEM